jgi:3-hydroxyisobutyrate dehydrogenase-like beta-hydroxyacid dehydrogenase
MIDCGVSGGPADVESGTSSLLVGASVQALRQVRPVLDVLGSIDRVGAVGSGKTAKLVNNVMTMDNILVAAEAFNLGTRAGIPAATLYSLLSSTGGRSHQFVKRFPWLVEWDFAARFSLALGEKDLSLTLTLARECGAPMIATSTIHQLYRTAGSLGSRGRRHRGHRQVVRSHECTARPVRLSRSVGRCR